MTSTIPVFVTASQYENPKLACCFSLNVLERNGRHYPLKLQKQNFDMLNHSWVIQEATGKDILHAQPPLAIHSILSQVAIVFQPDSEEVKKSKPFHSIIP